MNVDLALLVLRIVVGLTLAAHGAQKLFGVLGGSGLSATAEMFDKMGLRPGWLHARFAGAAEFLGGAFLAVGLLVPFASAAVIGVMTAAVLTVHLPNGFWNTSKGYEYNLLIAAVAFALAGIGPGSISLDGALGLDIAGAAWAVGALVAGVIGGTSARLTGRLSHEPRSPARA